ncbi:hypothetical protein [uncultured Chryseobacterium sp.]|uniref:hypothetical protein n=1 Tax=uncultured Chryseobacterium sp. TaxID=259322 RepID=UPI0025EF0A49|nr:hypothetical protein [uncultured Chryseobacterium sp.]
MSRNKILTAILFIIGILFLYNRIFSSENVSGFLDEMREKEIKSSITGKYINHNNHNIPFLVYGNKDSIIIYKDWWDQIFIGDSIIKPKGSVEIRIKNSNRFEKFNYEDKFGLE